MSISITTPIIQSLPISKLNNTNIWLKMEALQPSGSFKLRSISHACQIYKQQGAQRFISSSGGNAGIAVAYTGRQLKLPVTVVVPETTPKRARQLIQQEGAELIVHGKNWNEANALALSLVQENDRFIHPFDHELLWDGIVSMMDEIIADGLKPDAIVLSVGGGSLLSGVAKGLMKHDLSNTPIYAVETTGTASLNAAMTAKSWIKLEQVSGIATTLAAQQVCKQAFDFSQQLNIHSLVVSDKNTVDACTRFLNDHRVLVEPACGAALSVLYNQKIHFKPTDNVVVIVCGGASINLEMLLNYQRTITD